VVVIAAVLASGRVLETLVDSHAEYDITLFNGETR